jgi:hypothetical protein
MPLPTITPAYFSYDPNDITGFADGANFTGTWTSPNGGPPLSPVPGASAGHCVYRATGVDGRPALEFVPTSATGLYGSNAAVSAYTNNAAASANKPWSVALRVKIQSFAGGAQAFCGFTDSATNNTLFTFGATSASAWDVRRRDDVTSAGGLGVNTGTPALTTYSLITTFDGTNIALHINGTLFSSVAASSVNAYTPDRFSVGSLYRIAATALPANAQISKILVANDALGIVDRATVTTWLSAAPDVAIDIVGAASFDLTATGQLNLGSDIVGAASFDLVATGQLDIGPTGTSFDIVGAASFDLSATGQLALRTHGDGVRGQRRYYLDRRLYAESNGWDGLAISWKHYQEREAGNPLPTSFPGRAALIRDGHVSTLEDLDLYTPDEIAEFFGLSPATAKAAWAALPLAYRIPYELF